jgi:hypothetical protein
MDRGIDAPEILTMMSIADYFAALCSRLSHDLEPVLFSAELFADGSAPIRNQCHDNVDRLAAEKAGYRAVRGCGTLADPVDPVKRPD